MPSTISFQTFAQGLSSLGVRSGMSLEVHSALGAFGTVEGGADTVIDALLQAVGPEGALVMPAFRLSKPVPLSEEDRRMGVSSKVRILEADVNRTAMGLVADTFCVRPDVVLGEGISRVCAWGKNAARYAAEGLQPLIDDGGHALLLGTDFYTLSAMHCAEDALPGDIRKRFAPTPEMCAKYPEDEWIVEAWNPPTRPWFKIQSCAHAMGLITERRIGSAACMFFQLQPVVGLYRRALEQYPYSLYDL